MRSSAGWIWLVLVAAPARGALSPAPNPARYGLNPNGYSSAAVCGKCHSAIYNRWRNSMHGLSMSDPVFQSAFLPALNRNEGRARRLCLSCHSPTTRLTGDISLATPLSKEGVTCDFCHSVSGVSLGRADPFGHAPGLVKRGPRAGVRSPAHLTEQATYLTRSEFCGGCHDFRTENGTLLLGTYSEWRDGPYRRRGVQCQDCHMGKLASVPDVNPQIKRTAELAPDHGVLGGHYQQRLQDAATLTVSLRPTGRKLRVTVIVANVGAGHCVPTGVPTRRVELATAAMDAAGRTVGQAKRIYRKLLADPQGRLVSDLASSFIEPVTVLDDNRLRPGERRKEVFEFSLPPTNMVNVESTLTYKFETPVGTMDVPMAVASASVLLSPSPWESLAGLGVWLVCIVGLSLLLLVWLRRRQGASR